MPKKPTYSSTYRSTTKSTPATTVSRNTAIPRTTKREVTYDMIAKRAFEIFASGKGGSQVDNWLRAERELRGQ
jgi:Protein of unknown function (DUF2934)